MNSILDQFEPEKIDFKDINHVEDVEAQLELEADRILKAKAAKTQQQKQMQDMRDTQYYAVVVFGNKDDKDKFLSHFNDVEIDGETFIDGYQLANKIGLNIEMTASLPEPHYVKQLKIKQNGNKITGRTQSR
jgi:hypothetical protein